MAVSNTGAQEVLNWIEKNPNIISKIVAEVIGSTHKDDIETNLEGFIEILTAINIVGE